MPSSKINSAEQPRNKKQEQLASKQQALSPLETFTPNPRPLARKAENLNTKQFAEETLVLSFADLRVRMPHGDCGASVTGNILGGSQKQHSTTSKA